MDHKRVSTTGLVLACHWLRHVRDENLITGQADLAESLDEDEKSHNAFDAAKLS